MTVFEMVFGIVLVTTIAGIYKHHTKHKRAKTPDGEAVDRADYDSKVERIKELEERIKVLERIVTDKSARVADEIDRL